MRRRLNSDTMSKDHELVEFIQSQCALLTDHQWVERRGRIQCELCQKEMNEHDEWREIEAGFARELKF